MCSLRKAISSLVVMCSTWTRLPVSRARPISRCVHISAAVASRHTGCELGSPSTRRCMRSRNRYSSSEWNAARRRIAFRTLRNALVVLDQERARRRAHEHLDAAGAGKPFQVREFMGVLARSAHIKREIAVHAVMSALDLVGQRRRAGGRRLGVGHLEHRGDAAQHGAARTGLRGPPCGSGRARAYARGCRSRPGSTCRPRQSITSAADDPTSPIAAIRPPAMARSRNALAVLVDDRAALQNQVVAARHLTPPIPSP